MKVKCMITERQKKKKMMMLFHSPSSFHAQMNSFTVLPEVENSLKNIYSTLESLHNGQP